MENACWIYLFIQTLGTLIYLFIYWLLKELQSLKIQKSTQFSVINTLEILKEVERNHGHTVGRNIKTQEKKSPINAAQ